MSKKDIYDPQFVKALFDSMSQTYGLVNYITSFGFSERWRKQCVKDLPKINPNSKGYDMMSGMGESWKYVLKRLNKDARLIAIDVSDKMNAGALKHKKKLKLDTIELKKIDVFQNTIPSNSADFIISTFGIKTLSKEQRNQFAKEIGRILKSGGVFSIVEISKPEGWLLNGLYMFYLKYLIPYLGRIFSGSTEDYSMLAKYCEKFKNCRDFHEFLLNEELDSNYKKYFYGCATGVFGRKIK